MKKIIFIASTIVLIVGAEVLNQNKQAGIRIFGCGQSIITTGIDEKLINPDGTVEFLRVAVVSQYEIKG